MAEALVEGDHPTHPQEDVSLGATASHVARAVLFVTAIYVAGTQPFGLSLDRRNYEILYGLSATDTWTGVLTAGDAGYFGLSKLIADMGISFDTFVLLLSATTCSLLALTVRNVNTSRWALCLTYGSYLFWLHEYTQIRVAAGLSFFLYGVYARHWWKWLLFVPAVLLHNSLLFVVAIYLFLYIRSMSYRIIIAAAVTFLLTGPFSELLFSLVRRVILYQDLTQSGQFVDINLFSLMPLSQALFLVCASFWFKGFTRQQRNEWYISWIGIACFYIFSSVPVLAFRTYEMTMPIFVVFASRMWSRLFLFKVIIIPYVLLGLRSSFFTPDSLVEF